MLAKDLKLHRIWRVLFLENGQLPPLVRVGPEIERRCPDSFAPDMRTKDGNAIIERVNWAPSTIAFVRIISPDDPPWPNKIVTMQRTLAAKAEDGFARVTGDARGPGYGFFPPLSWGPAASSFGGGGSWGLFSPSTTRFCIVPPRGSSSLAVRLLHFLFYSRSSHLPGSRFCTPPPWPATTAGRVLSQPGSSHSAKGAVKRDRQATIPQTQGGASVVLQHLIRASSTRTGGQGRVYIISRPPTPCPFEFGDSSTAELKYSPFLGSCTSFEENFRKAWALGHFLPGLEPSVAVDAPNPGFAIILCSPSSSASSARSSARSSSSSSSSSFPGSRG
uniref:Uncharacterized protein n=1 Tax=Coccidioides posadasii RMSCC 3488 TaxID=454284 RepID=A0A0J6I108_COCPO|nr:hypothetical protein CPAG_01314 [Coccidioides posadasii RMSCC 3488]